MLFRSDRKSTRLNSSHTIISYAVFCLKKKKQIYNRSQSRSLRSTSGLGACRAPPTTTSGGADVAERAPHSGLHLLVFFFFLMIRRPPRSTLFPYTPRF